MAYGGTTKSAPVKYRVPLLTHQKLKNQPLSPSLLPSRTYIIQERQKRRQLTVTPCFTVEVNSLSLSLSVSMSVSVSLLSLFMSHVCICTLFCF